MALVGKKKSDQAGIGGFSLVVGPFRSLHTHLHSKHTLFHILDRTQLPVTLSQPYLISFKSRIAAEPVGESVVLVWNVDAASR
jgi:hypothetical protein